MKLIKGISPKTISPLILFIFCFFIYPVGSKISAYSYSCGISFIYILFNLKFIKLSAKLIKILGTVFVLILLSVIYPIIHGTNDFSFLPVTIYILRMLLIYVFLILLIVKKYKEKASWEYFIYYYILATATYVVGTMILVFLPTVQIFWFNIFDPTNDRVVALGDQEMYKFRYGWQGFSGFACTLNCTISSILLLYLFYMNRKNDEFKIANYQFLITFFLCIIGNMFYGRTGLLCSVFTNMVGLCIWNRKHFVKVIKFMFIMTAFVFGVYLLRDISMLESWYRWTTTPLINFFTTGHFNSASLDYLVDHMYFLPKIETLFFGDGYFMSNGSFYMRTDAGIMRNILFWGIFATVLLYGLTIYSIMELKKRSLLLSILILSIFVIFEYKGTVSNTFAALFLSTFFIDSVKRNYLRACLHKKHGN